MVSFYGTIVNGDNLQLHIVLALNRVSTIGGIISIVKVIAIVAHQRFDTRLFVRQVDYTKGITSFEQTLCLMLA